MEMNTFGVIVSLFMLLISAGFGLISKIIFKKISDLETAITSLASINTELSNLKSTLGDAQQLWDRMRACEKEVATISTGCQFEREKYKDLHDKVGVISGKVGENEKNYVNRFEELKQIMVNSKDEIMKQIGELKLNLVENYVKRSEINSGKKARGRK